MHSFYVVVYLQIGNKHG